MRSDPSQQGADRRICELRELAELEAASALFSQLWAEPSGSGPVSPHLLKALQLTGNYVFGAFSPRGDLEGATVAWAAPRLGADLHSHITGVAPEAQGRGVGLSLKLHQREWALANGFATVSWTYDPLVKRNASFNLSRLGAGVADYLVNLYGEMEDSLNLGDESDRFLIRWELSAPEVLAAAGGTRKVITGDFPILLGPDAKSYPAESELPAGTTRALVAVPENIDELRLHDPERARAWRRATRTVFSDLFARNGGIEGLDEQGRYVVRLAASA